MIVIKNISDEELELVTHVDPRVNGCRVKNGMPPSRMKPGDDLCFQGYEPGVSYTIRPLYKPEIPRVSELENGEVVFNQVHVRSKL